MTKRSMYIDKDNPEHVEDGLHIIPGKSQYLFVYPFVKTREWYSRADGRSERRSWTSTSPSVQVSLGKDPHDLLVRSRRPGFVVAFEADPARLLDLVQELRETKAVLHRRDTPMFTCRPALGECLEALG